MSILEKHFAIAYFVVAVGLIVADAVLQILAQARVPDPAGVVTLIPAVWYAGTRYAERNDSVPDSRQFWILSLEFALIALLISLAVTGVMMFGFSGSEAMSDIDPLFDTPLGALIGISAFSVLLTTLIVRISLPMAMRSGFESRKR